MSVTALKIIALVCMTIDHIGEFFPNSPIFFRWIGRLSAPIFFFCAVEGILHTKNRITYLIRLYIFSIIMASMAFIINKMNFGSIYVDNNIFMTIFAFSVIISLIEEKKKGNPNCNKLVFTYCIWQVFSLAITYCLMLSNHDDIGILFAAICGNIFISEGRIPFVLLGIILYCSMNSKKKILINYTLFCILYELIIIFDIFARIVSRLQYYGYQGFCEILHFIFGLLGFDTIYIRYGSFLHLNITISDLINRNFQWMMIFSLPLILLYNGKRGKGYKYFFYIYYPFHILLLVFISYLLL